MMRVNRLPLTALDQLLKIMQRLADGKYRSG